MADLDKVLNGLEHCKKYGSLCGKDCFGHYERYTEDGCAIKLVGNYRSACPYKDDNRGCIVGLTDDVYDLLKFQQAEIEQLKEREAIEPISYHRSDGTIFKYECGQCRTKIFKMDLFCRHCGRLLKWALIR